MIDKLNILEYNKNMDKSNIIELEFLGPYSFLNNEFSVNKSPLFDKKCIYLWTIRQENNSHFIHYVGETTSLAKRQREHLVHILGLNYGIWDINEAESGISKIIWDGLWRIKDKINIGNLIDVYEKYNKNIIEYVSKICIFAAEINCNDSLRKHIEGCIGWNLRNKHPEHKLFYPDDCHVGHGEKSNGYIRVNCKENILGIDESIEY
jgi:hypothetical protein